MAVRPVAAMFAMMIGALACTGCVAEGPDPLHIPDPMKLPPHEACAHVEGSDAELPQWDILLQVADWDALHVDVYADVTVDALLCVDGKPFPVTMELQGASTRGQPKKAFDLKLKDSVARADSPFFNDELIGEGLPRAILKAMYRDATLVRESIAFDLWRMLGHDAPRTDYVNLRINGSDRGLYVLVEPVDETYLDTYGYGDEGTLYKGVRKHGSRADFAPGRDLYAAFENKTHDTHDKWTDLEDLVKRLQTTALTEEAFTENIDAIFSLDAYMDRMLWVSFTQNSDAIAQNFYLHNRTSLVDGAQWELIPWDSNVCLGMVWNRPNQITTADAQPLLDGGNYFSRRLLKVPALQQRYVARYRAALNEVFTPETLLALERSHSERVAFDLARDQEIWQREIGPERASSELATFVAGRTDAMHDAIDAWLDPSDDDDEHTEEDEHEERDEQERGEEEPGEEEHDEEESD